MALRPMPGGAVSGSILDNHLRALAAPHAMDVASSERHTVKPWFNGRIPHSPQVADLTNDGFPLIGGRVDVVNTQPVATLVYGRRKHLISLSALPTGDASEQSLTPNSIRGFNIVRWNDDGVAYWAASDLNAAELQTFAKLFQTAVARR
jgi:anti-sigma factor RsiW